MEKLFRLKLFIDRLRYCRQKHFYAMMAALVMVLLTVFSGIYLKMKSDLQVKDNVLKSYYGQADSTQLSAISVYICGQVLDPGVYDVSPGDRVCDVLEMAGGPTGDAALDSVNLARKVSDEEKILIPKAGQEDGSLLNINAASSQLLQSLPGIGPAIARNMVEYRNTNGPFKSKEDLKEVDGIGDKKFQEIKDLISI
ncbi:MAG: helix-hairpin-helix domain-containing protein [Actinomycetia bacterium]|nr:helix-hairpin-helix domain-containing protein [Actinomycetes bacterium]